MLASALPSGSELDLHYLTIEWIMRTVPNFSISKGENLFRFFYNANPHLKDNQFEDKTEYEHSVNDFHFNDYCRNCSINHVFLFVNRLKEMAIKMCVSSTMAITISSDNDDFSLSFTTMHGDERPWISPYDLDNFSQPIMIVIIEKITVTGHKGTDM